MNLIRKQGYNLGKKTHEFCKSGNIEKSTGMDIFVQHDEKRRNTNKM